MSIAEDQEPTPAHVAQKATQSAHLPALALIGIFGSAEAPAALIRERSGTIQRVTVGDTVAGQTVAAIDTDRVILASGSRTKTLTFPEG